MKDFAGGNEGKREEGKLAERPTITHKSDSLSFRLVTLYITAFVKPPVHQDNGAVPSSD